MPPAKPFRSHRNAPAARRPPYGKLEQRELAYLRLVGASAVERWLVVVLRIRASGNGRVSDTIPKLAEWSGLGETTVKASLKRLKELGVIERDPHSFKSGERGRAWYFETVPLPFEEWAHEESPDDSKTEGRGVAARGEEECFHEG